MRVGPMAFNVLLLAGIAQPALATDILVYDDALAANFLNFSYVSGAGSVAFASTTQVHTGTHSIAFTAGGFDAVKIANDTQMFDTAVYPIVHFWFYGSTAQCQRIDLILERERRNLPGQLNLDVDRSFTRGAGDLG